MNFKIIGENINQGINVKQIICEKRLMIIKWLSQSFLFSFHVSRGTILVPNLGTNIHLCVITHKIPEETNENENYLHSRWTRGIQG